MCLLGRESLASLINIHRKQFEKGGFAGGEVNLENPQIWFEPFAIIRMSWKVGPPLKQLISLFRAEILFHLFNININNDFYFSRRNLFLRPN